MNEYNNILRNNILYTKEIAEKIIDNYNKENNIFEKEDIVRNMYSIDKNVVKHALNDFDQIVSIIENNLNTIKTRETSKDYTIAFTNKRSFIQMMSEMSSIIDADNKEFNKMYIKLSHDLNIIRGNITMLDKQLSYMK
uniref:ABC transporter domain-containing protein n=1 Tax=Strongyloides stercoralis TaxID=6248 RepID=A0A0K0ECK2_STRER